MLRRTRLFACLVLTLCALSSALGQDAKTDTDPETTPIVTASASAKRVRFTAPSAVVQLQLQVYSALGQKLFDTELRGGNVLDWSLEDNAGQRLPTGSYLSVLTIKSLSGRLRQRVGFITVDDKKAAVEVMGAAQLSAAQQIIGPIEGNAAFTVLQENQEEAITAVTHDSTDGQVARTRGALTFRIGDFFSGTDKEQMRLTEDGNLGVGTAKPKARLDVAGMIRAREGFQFFNGSKLSVNEKGALTLTNSSGDIVPNVAGTGTLNRLAKWTDSGGTLGDSVALDTGTGLQLTAAPSLSVDTNLLYLNNTNGTTGVLAGSTPSYGANNGPFFAMRGNTYTTIANQRGLFTIAAGNVANPGGDDGSVKFNTGNDLLRMVIRPAGNVGIAVSNPGSLLDVGGDINTSTQYNILGSRAFSIVGTSTFAGSGAGMLNTNVNSYNSFFGLSAGTANTAGANNAFFGAETGQSNTMGEQNSFFGKQAGSANTMGTGNSFFGFAAGAGNVDGGDNTAIGISATVVSGSLNNATAIGARAQVNQSNSLVLGSINGFNGASANTKVGIGITAPSATLHVVAYTNSSGENTATFQAPNIGSNQSHIHYGTTGDWYIRSAASAGKVILQDSGGNVGIGTGTPVAKLDVRDGTGASGSGGHLQIGADSANADEKIISFGDLNCGSVFTPRPCVSIGEQDANNRMVLRAADFRFYSGPFGVGSVSPDIDGSHTLGLSSNRWSEVFAINGMIQTSDVRLKRGITNLKYGLSQVMQLRPVSFQWKSGNDKRTHLGLIAQEVDAVMPEAVEKSADAAAPLGMNYSTLIPVLIKAIQEQQGTLERAQAEINTLRAENDALSRRIVAIEATATKKAQ